MHRTRTEHGGCFGVWHKLGENLSLTARVVPKERRLLTLLDGLLKRVYRRAAVAKPHVSASRTLVSDTALE